MAGRSEPLRRAKQSTVLSARPSRGPFLQHGFERQAAPAWDRTRRATVECDSILMYGDEISREYRKARIDVGEIDEMSQPQFTGRQGLTSHWVEGTDSEPRRRLVAACAW